MTYLPFSPEHGGVYHLYNPATGITATFNDTTSGNYVGMLSEVSGLDSAEVRESAEDLVQSDGGTHGDFYYGRRPIVLTGLVFGHSTKLQRRTRLDKMARASDLMRQDGFLIMDYEDADINFMTIVRRQQPVRVSGGWNKDFQIPLVSQYAQIFSELQYNASAAAGVGVTIENRGSALYYPVFRVTGPTAGGTFNIEQTEAGGVNVDGAAGQPFFYSTTAVPSGQTWEIDTLSHTMAHDDGSPPTQWPTKNQYIDFQNTIYWPYFYTGNNTYVLSGGTGSLQVLWRHAWV